MIGRREFITLIGSAAAAWPIAVRAQQSAMRRIGFLNSGSPEPFARYVDGFLKGLGEVGFTVGRNAAIEFRWAEGNYDRLPELAAELATQQVDVIVATGGEPSGRAAKAATSSIPIVFAAGGDPVKAGLVTSLNRPSGNLTGISQFTYSLEAKRLGLLHEMTPAADPIGVLINTNNPNAPDQVRDLQEAAARAGVRLMQLPIGGESDLEPAFETLAAKRVTAALITADPFFNTRRSRLVALTAANQIAAMYEFREFAVAGGLMSYGSNLVDGYRQVGVYAGRILNGAKPTELPVLQPTFFELVINLQMAKVLGLEVPPTLLARADEVIE